MSKLTNQAYEKAVKILHENATLIGFSATTERYKNYHSVWARDHSIVAIAACLTKEQKLIDTAVKGLQTLLKNQADQGQVPSYIEIEGRKRVYGGLGHITSIDSNMWVAIASAIIYNRTGDKRLIQKRYIRRLRRLYFLLRSFDSNYDGLVEVHQAGDWADVFNRYYHVLYDQVLYYMALRSINYLMRQVEEKSEMKDIKKKIRSTIKYTRKRSSKTKRRINNYLWLTKENIPIILDEYMIYHKNSVAPVPFYQSHLAPFKLYWHHRFDAFGNILAMATGIASQKKCAKIVRHVTKEKINRPYPLLATYPVVMPKDLDWEEIYDQMERPYCYHNGGIWPVVTGFWVYALQKKGFGTKAKEDLELLAELCKKQQWSFNEWFHGKTAKPIGRKNQAWSAAGYIIAHKAVYETINIFTLR